MLTPLNLFLAPWHRPVPRLFTLLAAGVATIALAGCVTSGARERYYASRGDPVGFTPGDRSERLSLSPAELEPSEAMALIRATGSPPDGMPELR